MKERMHYTHFPQINDIYSNSSFQRKRKLVRKNVGVLPSYVSLVIPVKIQSLCYLIMSGLLWLQEKKVSEFVDTLLKKQKFCLSKRLLLSLRLIFFHSKTVVQMFWNGGFKGWRTTVSRAFIVSQCWIKLTHFLMTSKCYLRGWIIQ